MANSVSGAQSGPCACGLVLWMCVCVYSTYLYACEIECKRVVSCRPQCRLMAYRQVIYDLSVAGREKGDTRLSPQINKRCSGAHITSPLHVCERTDLALALFYFFLFFCLLKQLLAFCLSSHLAFFCSFLSFSTYFTTFFLCAPLLISCNPPPFPLPPLVVFVLPPLSAGSWGLWHASHHLQKYGVKSISWRTPLQQ